MQRNLLDFLIRHRVVLQREPAVGEHKRRVILLSTFDSPWGIDQDNVELANFLHKQVPVEALDVAVDKSVISSFVKGLLSFVEDLSCGEVFLAVAAEVFVEEWKFEGRGVLGVGFFVVVVFFVFVPFFGVFPLKFTFGA
jgi:hypothetical protein